MTWCIHWATVFTHNTSTRTHTPTLTGPVSGLLDALRSRLPNPEEHEADLVVASFSRIAAAKRAQEAAEGEGKEGSKGDRPMEVVVKSGGLTKVHGGACWLSSSAAAAVQHRIRIVTCTL